jgi:uncharacterized membrane protein (UPF0127 family)
MSSPEDIEKGMMGRESLEGGMGFRLRKGYHFFHMKNCLIPLDIVFVLNGRISTIHRDCQPCNDEDCKKYTGAADIVFEFPSGTAENFKEGDRAILYLGTKYNPV